MADQTQTETPMALENPEAETAVMQQDINPVAIASNDELLQMEDCAQALADAAATEQHQSYMGMN